MACGLTLPSTGAPQLQRKRQLKTRSSTMSKSGNKSGKGEQQREDGVGDNQHISEQFLPKVWAISLSRARTNPQPQPHAHRHTSTHSPSPSLLIAFLLSLPPHCLPRFGAVRHAMPGALASGGPAPRMRGWQGAGRHRARPESSTDHPGHCPRRRAPGPLRAATGAEPTCRPSAARAVVAGACPAAGAGPRAILGAESGRHLWWPVLQIHTV